MPKAIELKPGQRFGLWVVIGPAPRREPPGSHHVYRRYKVKCLRCGDVQEILATNLKCGRSKGCRTCRSGMVFLRRAGNITDPLELDQKLEDLL